MGITVTNQDILIRLPKARLDAIEREFEGALQDEATRIVLRTRQGTDVNGNAFAAYSPAYAKRRQAKGRNQSPVDLTFTGKMLAAVQTKVERLAGKVVGTIFFNSAAEAVKAQGNQKTRRFFGLSAEQIHEINQPAQGSQIRSIWQQHKTTPPPNSRTGSRPRATPRPSRPTT